MADTSFSHPGLQWEKVKSEDRKNMFGSEKQTNKKQTSVSRLSPHDEAILKQLYL